MANSCMHTVTSRGCAGPHPMEQNTLCLFLIVGIPWHREPCSHAAVPALGFTSQNTPSPQEAPKTSSQHFLVGLRSHWQLISCTLMAKPELSTEFLLPNPMCAGHTELELCKQSPFLSDSGCTLQMHDVVVKEFVTNNPSAQPCRVVLAHAVC